MTEEITNRSGPEVFVVLDAQSDDVVRVADFWAAALHYRRAQSVEQYEVLVPEEGDGFAVLIQGVPEPKDGKNRMHLDLHVDDPDAEVERLLALGAIRTGEGSIGSMSWTTMHDPAGNEFCLGKRM